jgi:hypothetical protein
MREGLAGGIEIEDRHRKIASRVKISSDRSSWRVGVGRGGKNGCSEGTREALFAGEGGTR